MLLVRGATEEIEFRLDNRGSPTMGRRRRLSQTRIAMVAKHEFHKFAGEINVTNAAYTDLQGLEALLSEPIVSAKIAKIAKIANILTDSGPAPVAADTQEAVAEDEAAQEQLVEQIAAEDEAAQEQLVEEIAAQDEQQISLDIDVPRLWRVLVDTEKELTTEGVALADSAYDPAIGRHRVLFDLESGAFDFSRNDTVGVLRQDRRGGWRRIGELDIKNTHVNAVVIEGADYGAPSRARLVEAGQRLRFISHFETESLRRRTDAVERVLARSNEREAKLAAVFDPRAGAQPSDAGHEVKLADLAAYELNDDQVAAFIRIIRARPVGLLQGPPGTGKTRFIAALAHYAITHNLARNVLLSSQSHEAVNTAGEALLKLFRKSGGDPIVLRVAMSDEQVSDPIRPFHTARVEQAFKDRFEASFRERMGIAGKAVGLPGEPIEAIITAETDIRPIAAKVAELLTEEAPDLQRINSLKESLTAHFEKLGLSADLAEGIGTDAESYMQAVFDRLARRSGQAAIASDKISRLRTIIALGRDFIGSASRPQRSFEAFLAGTRQIVVGTCVGLGRASLGLTATPFDLVIVDEAARCTASELLVPLQAARWAVLVGDQAQLEPTHEAEVVNRVAEHTQIYEKGNQAQRFRARLSLLPTVPMPARDSTPNTGCCRRSASWSQRSSIPISCSSPGAASR